MENKHGSAEKDVCFLCCFVSLAFQVHTCSYSCTYTQNLKETQGWDVLARSPDESLKPRRNPTWWDLLQNHPGCWLVSEQVWGPFEEQWGERNSCRHPCLAKPRYQHVFPPLFWRKEKWRKHCGGMGALWPCECPFQLVLCLPGSALCVAWDTWWSGTCCVSKGLSRRDVSSS